MKMRVIRTLTLLFVFGTCTNAYACRCAERTVGEAINNADIVAVGTILNKRKLSDTSIARTITKRAYFAYDLVVERAHKGKIEADTISINTGSGGGDCGVPFKIGTRYIVYIEKETDGHSIIFFTNRCMLTNEYSLADEDEIKKYIK